MNKVTLPSGRELEAQSYTFSAAQLAALIESESILSAGAAPNKPSAPPTFPLADEPVQPSAAKDFTTSDKVKCMGHYRSGSDCTRTWNLIDVKGQPFCEKHLAEGLGVATQRKAKTAVTYGDGSTSPIMRHNLSHVKRGEFREFGKCTWCDGQLCLGEVAPELVKFNTVAAKAALPKLIKTYADAVASAQAEFGDFSEAEPQVAETPAPVKPKVSRARKPAAEEAPKPVVSLRGTLNNDHTNARGRVIERMTERGIPADNIVVAISQVEGKLTYDLDHVKDIVAALNKLR